MYVKRFFLVNHKNETNGDIEVVIRCTVVGVYDVG